MARYIKSFQNDAAIQAAVDDKSLGKPYVALDDQLHRIDWNTKSDTPDYSKMYLTIEALSGGTFYVRKANVGYSVNGGAWETTTGETALSLNQGHKVRFKGTDGGKSLFSGNTLAFNAYGNIESLEYGDDFEEVTSVKNVSGFAFCFSGCTGLFSAENLVLPAATLVNSCYMGMFGGCTNMKDAPAIPATALAEGCCSSMFIACKNLEIGPELNAETLYSSSYGWMFQACNKLKYIKCMATNVPIDSTTNWLYSVSPTGTFVKKAGVTWLTGNSGIPSGWTVIEE